MLLTVITSGVGVIVIVVGVVALAQQSRVPMNDEGANSGCGF